MAEYDESQNYFTVKKAPVDAEISVDKLPKEAQALFKGKGGSREKETGKHDQCIYNRRRTC
eukprot:6522136-Karenia_brevis.AAC.1